MSVKKESDGVATRLVTALGRASAAAPLPGRGRVMSALGRLAARVAPAAYAYPARDVPVRVDLRGRMERLMWAGVYEREVVALLERLLGPGMTFLDIGANIGYFSALASALVGPAGAVHAFEPDPRIHAQLEGNSRDRANVHPHAVAVSDRVGESVFYRSPSDTESGWGTLVAPGDPAREQLTVRTTTLDGWAEESGLGRTDVIKIDVEGAEHRVLRGARETLHRLRPILIMEVGSSWLEGDRRAFQAMLDILGEARLEPLRAPAPAGHGPDSLVAVPAENTALIERLLREPLPPSGQPLGRFTA